MKQKSSAKSIPSPARQGEHFRSDGGNLSGFRFRRLSSLLCLMSRRGGGGGIKVGEF